MKTRLELEGISRRIVAKGGQILLPFQAADAEVKFQRWELARLITNALIELQNDIVGIDNTGLHPRP